MHRTRAEGCGKSKWAPDHQSQGRVVLRVLLLIGLLSLTFGLGAGSSDRGSSPAPSVVPEARMAPTQTGPAIKPDFVPAPPVRLGVVNGSMNGWSSVTAWAIQNLFVMSPTFMSPSGESWDLGDGLSENQTGTTNFTSSSDPDFDHVTALLTDAIDEVVELDTWWVPSGGGGGSAAYETYWFARTPDFVGFKIDFVRLVVLTLSIYPSNGGTQVDETYSWELWGHRVFVAFRPPTDPDGAYLIDRRSTTINVSLVEAGTAVVNFDGTNETMVGSLTEWELTLSGLANGVYVYQVWAQNSTGSVFASEVRHLTVGAGIWTTLPVGYGLMPSLAFDQNGVPHLCFYGGDISGNMGLVYATLSSNRWVNQSLEGTSGSTGQQCSIAIDQQGTPHISYISGPDYGGNYVVKHAYLNGGSWAFESVASSQYTQTSIAINPVTDRPAIAYYVVPNGGLTLASENDGTWSSLTVDGGYAGFNPSLAFDALGRPRIAYSGGLTYELRYAEWTGASWAISVIDPTSVWTVSLKVDRFGASHVAFGNSTGLVYASQNGATWVKEVVDRKHFYSVALAFDGSDNPHIGYAMGWSGDVRYAVHNGTWRIQVVSHNMGDTGIGMALDPLGYAGLAFGTNRSFGDLVFATDVVDTGPPATTALIAGKTGANGWYTSFVSVTLNAADWSGVASTSYRLDGGSWTSYSNPFSIRTEGVHTIEFFSTDLSGNVEAVRSAAIKIDATPPTISGIGPTGPVTTNDVTLFWGGSDNTSGIEEFRLSIDGGAFDSMGKSTSVKVRLGDGAHRLTLEVFDTAGNVATAEARFQVDTYAFSFTGPFHGYPTLLLAVAVAVAPPLAYALYARRKQGAG